MVICIVVSHLGGGGAEHVAAMLANGFAYKGHEVYLATDLVREGHYSIQDNVNTYNIITYNKKPLLKWIAATYNLRKLFMRKRPDVVLGVMELCSAISKIAAFGMGISVISTEHNSFERPVNAPFSKMEYFSKYWLNRLFDAVTVLTYADKKAIGSKIKHIAVMPNPLAFRPVEEITKKKSFVMAVGRLDDWYTKGFDVLIKAWGILKRISITSNATGQILDKANVSEIQKYSLKIVGEGSKKSSEFLKQLSKEYGVEDSVEILGFRKDIDALYQEAMIFVLSSRYEGFGLVLIEAMSQGCAPVACDYKGRQREIIDPSSVLPQGEEEQSAAVSEFCVCDNGILCEPDNAEQLAAAIARMISDDNYRVSVQQNAISRSRYYSIENTVDRWEQLLNSIIRR